MSLLLSLHWASPWASSPWVAVLVVAALGSLCPVAALARPASPLALAGSLGLAGPPDAFEMHLANKRTATGPGDMAAAQDDGDYPSGVRYDEYPVVVPKRTAVMVDRIFGILKNAVNGDGTGGGVRAVVPDERMDLQRRGQQKGRVYWRCYFNAVTCFRRRK